MEILVVEDNLGDVKLFLEEFKELKLLANFHVETNGLEALKFLHKEDKFIDAPKPDLLVLDLNIPKKNGIEILKDMNGNENLRDIPVVIFSALVNQKAILKDCKNIHHIFITKPNTLEEYDGVIKDVEKFCLRMLNR